MEEDVGAPVKVTRLRRRLSVEQSDDVSSPSTPTKKRGGRLAAKPQLELIDENAQISSPRKPRRKSIVKDVVEAEEKTLTPSRRSTRIKSNTSIVSETLAAQVTDSPRAKRALRRTSAAGSDNEGPLTPARQTRRTRKDSASSVDTQEPAPINRPLQVVEMVINEEPENEEQKPARKSKSSPNKSVEKLSPDSARKSKRLSDKINRRSGSLIANNDSSVSAIENKSLNASVNNESSEMEKNTKSKSRKSIESKDSEKISDTETKSHNKSRKSIESTESEKISDSEAKSHKKSRKSIESNKSGNLSESLKAIESESNNKSSKHNKSTSNLHTEQNGKKKRNRTESLPSLATVSPSSEKIVFSDNEQAKKKKRQSVNKSFLNNSGLSKTGTKEDSTDSMQIIINEQSKKKKRQSVNKSVINNTETKEDTNDAAQNENEHLIMSPETSTERRKRQSEMSLANVVDLTIEPVETPVNSAQSSSNNENSSVIRQPTVNTEQQPGNSGMSAEMALLFQSRPESVQAIIFFEDTDSNTVSETAKEIEQLDNEDQCVPEVAHGLEFQEKISPEPTITSNGEVNIFQPQPKSSNDEVDSCEPMDIDETISEEILQKSHDMLQQSTTERKSLSLQQSGIMEERNKSKRKSSLNSIDTPDRSGHVVSSNENKSTLILSQIKDVSGTSETAQQSPKAATAESLSNSNNSDINTSNKLLNTNLSSKDLKGTPIKQKSVLKVAMQTSTPINTPQTDNKTKIEGKYASIIKNASNLSKSIDEIVSDEDSDEDSDEESEQKSNLLDDEAEEASDDYESGDSRDEEEREYEVEHEIVERGETLGSDDEASNDTDYEKDSFVVSSDAEDNDLLSGSGDDLSMSDNELSMSKKSKKKYNERKLKEQKTASREMYESRHKLNISDSKSPAPKTKNNRMRLDSSLIESDEEVVVKSKKKNRLRLDSTLDQNTRQGDTNESLNRSKKKGNKSLQNSISNQSAINEKEITVCNENISVTDPLQVQFKQEPKTPQKDLNISVVQFTDRQDIENVEVAPSDTILNGTVTDPLQASMVCDDYDSSESEEIMQNYDSMLNELNANKKSKLNVNNISLNVGKKSKKDKNLSIIDKLNLTNIKNSNKNTLKSEDVVDSKRETSKVIQADNEDSNNSIDLQLLFSEDNIGSGDENACNKNDQNNEEEEMFVPLRKSAGNTNMNIHESLGVNTSEQNSTLNESKKKKKKRKSCSVSDDTAESEDINKSIHDVKLLNESIKKKNRKSSDSKEVEEVQVATPIEDESLLNKSNSKKKQRASVSISELESSVATPIEDASLLNKSNSKKKHRASVSISELESSVATPIEDASLLNISNSKKKQRASVSISELESSDVNNSITSALNESSRKKKNRNTSAVELLQDVPIVEEPVLNESIKKKKKRKSSLVVEDLQPDDGDLFFIDTVGAFAAETVDKSEPVPLEVLYASEKKNKKLNLSQNVEANDDVIEESSPKVTSNTKNKKKKNKKQNLEASVIADVDSDDAPEEVMFRSEKAANQETELTTEIVAETAETGSSKKKKKKKKKTSIVSAPSLESSNVSDEPQSSKKRKRKPSDPGVQSSAQDVEQVVSGSLEPTDGSSKKKRKISNNSEADELSHAEVDVTGDRQKKNKKKKQKNNELIFENTVPETEIVQTQGKKNKKRKERDEDNDSKKTKVSKEDSFHEVHNVPRPSTSRPEERFKKPKVISTSNFTVTNARQNRAKPSNYLEQSIYLNDDSPFGKKEKPRVKNPKVLPFVPTAAISESGYTTNFKINKLSQNIQFVAEPAGISFSKESYLQRKEIKRLGTYDRYKNQINKKLSKF